MQLQEIAMTDVIISGDAAVRKPAPPPTEVVEMPATVPSAGETLPERNPEDVRLKHISDPITLSEDGRELRRKGEPDPIYEWRADAAMPEPGPSESHDKQIRRASQSMHQARLAALGEEFAKVPGATPESGRAAAEFVAAASAFPMTVG